jgi:hypothetical protein
VDFKAFRATAASKLIFSNGKMTVPAAHLVVFDRYQSKDLVFAGFHDEIFLIPFIFLVYYITAGFAVRGVPVMINEAAF